MIYTDGKHLVADFDKELHRFAKSIGLKAEWFQNHRIPHYDLFRSKTNKALEMGAIKISTRELVKMFREESNNK